MLTILRRMSGIPVAAFARARREDGQSAVEFALVVPFLCVVLLAILDFGKAMNYWLDLNHIASATARKAAVNSYATAGQYQTYARDNLETGELQSGGTESIPTAASISICLPEGGDVGDPVMVRVAVGYRWIPFIASTTWNIHGTATMRIEQKASYSGVGTCS